VLDPDFTIVEAARAAATGYSFPSGHTQIAVGCYAGLALCRRERWVRAIGIALSILIPFTRMYLGVHTPLDVGVSILIALALVLILWILLSKYGLSPRLMVPLMGMLTVFGAAFLLYTNLYTFPADIDPDNYAGAVKNGFKFLGCTLGMWCMYLLDRYRIRFDTKTASVWGQVLKLSLGFVLVVAVLEGSKPLWHIMLGDSPVTYVLRYFLTVIVAGVIWPLTFPWFARIGAKKPRRRKEAVMVGIKLSPLCPNDVAAYTALYEEAFPPEERKPLDYMLTGDHASAYEVLVISTEDVRVAGLVITVRHGDLVMLDYFAVSPALRGHGIGRAALPLIRDRYANAKFFLEIERPVEGCGNYAQRVRRAAFYASAGMVNTAVLAHIYGTEMELLAFPEDAASITFEGYASLIAAHFPPEMRPGKI
jgi:GNAT superfamily N-acetyltransferase